MNINRYLLIRVVTVLMMASIGSCIVEAADFLYIGDGSDNTVKRFDASTGKYLGIFVTNKGCENPPSSPPLLIWTSRSHI
jgi:hypothetical protein